MGTRAFNVGNGMVISSDIEYLEDQSSNLNDFITNVSRWEEETLMEEVKELAVK